MPSDLCADVDLTPRAEEAFRLEAERVGAYAIDPDVAAQNSAAYNFLSDTTVLLATVGA